MRRSTARVVDCTRVYNFLHMVLLEGIPHHRATRLGDDAFSLQRRVEPVAQFDRAVLPVWGIVQNPDQGIQVPIPR